MKVNGRVKSPAGSADLVMIGVCAVAAICPVRRAPARPAEWTWPRVLPGLPIRFSQFRESVCLHV